MPQSIHIERQRIKQGRHKARKPPVSGDTRKVGASCQPCLILVAEPAHALAHPRLSTGKASQDINGAVPPYRAAGDLRTRTSGPV